MVTIRKRVARKRTKKRPTAQKKPGTRAKVWRPDSNPRQRVEPASPIEPEIVARQPRNLPAWFWPAVGGLISAATAVCWGLVEYMRRH